jgi:hypothetical protein
MNTAPPETVELWAPNMVYRVRCHKNLTPTLCEKFIEQQVFTFFRTYLPMSGPNYDYGPVMERATRFVLYIVSRHEETFSTEHRTDRNQDLLRNDVDFHLAFFKMLQNRTSPNSCAAAISQDRELANLLEILADMQWSGNDSVAAARVYKLVSTSSPETQRSPTGIHRASTLATS